MFGLIASTIVLLVLWVGVNRVWTDTLSTGQLVAFIWIGFQLNETLKRLATAAVAAQKSWVSSTRILHLLSRSAEPGRGEKYRKRRWRADIFEIRDRAGNITPVQYTRPGIYELSAGLDLERLIDELLGFKKTRELQISIDDKCVDQFNIHQVRQLIGWITTRSALFSGTIKDNLLLDSSETADAIGSLPPWVKNYCPAETSWEGWLEMPIASIKPNRRGFDRAISVLVRSSLHGARIFIVEPDAYEALPAELWDGIADNCIVLRESGDARSPPQRKASVQQKLRLMS